MSKHSRLDPFPLASQDNSSTPTRDILVTSTSVITGAILGWALSALGATHFSQETLILILVALVSVPTAIVVIYLSYASFRATRSGYVDTVRFFSAVEGRIDGLIAQRATLLNRDEAYEAMTRAVDGAKSQVVLLATLFFDWEGHKRTYTTAVTHSQARERLFRALFDAIEREDLEYLRIFQLPPERHSQLTDVLKHDDLYRKEVDLILKIQPDHPERARLVLTEEATNASLVIIDRRQLFINIDIFDPIQRTFKSPYVIFVQDAGEDAFIELTNLITEITTRRYHPSKLDVGDDPDSHRSKTSQRL